jgi:hypothetical protein
MSYGSSSLAGSPAKEVGLQSNLAMSSRIENLQGIGRQLEGVANEAETLAMFAAGGAPLTPPTGNGPATVAPVPHGMVEQIDQTIEVIRGHIGRLDAAHNRARQALS